MVGQNLAEILHNHAMLELEAIDRKYRNGAVERLGNTSITIRIYQGGSAGTAGGSS